MQEGLRNEQPIETDSELQRQNLVARKRAWIRHRTVVLVFVCLTTYLGVSRLQPLLNAIDSPVLSMALLCVFALLFAWICLSFAIASLGAWLLWRGPSRVSLTTNAVGHVASPSRTAVVMPIYNEDPQRVTEGLLAMIESLQDTSLASSASRQRPFDFYLLSDSNDPACQQAEHVAWRALRDKVGSRVRVYYRHRPRNIERKSGNIADFCRNWGAGYDYMIVLDADSLMSGNTLCRLVQMMDEHPRTALIQVPPQLVGRDSAFARIQQFASSLYGPLYATGWAALQGPDGNYWGHNAILRVSAFVQCCGLPRLAGRGPLAGEILSHDFVEAALLGRAGWDIWMAANLGGSYEEPPPTLADHLVRDRRWCHGNLQHLKLVAARGFKHASRLHFAIGIMNYLAAPLWALMLGLAVVAAHRLYNMAPVLFVGRYPVLRLPLSLELELLPLLAGTATLLYAPKVMALALACRDARQARAHGGVLLTGLSVLFEIVLSTLVAPIAGLSHCRFVTDTLLGRRPTWGTQQRSDRRVSLGYCTRLFGFHTLIGVLLCWVIWRYVEPLTFWFVPLMAGLVLSVPIVAITSDPRIGRWLRNKGLFLTPAETLGFSL